MISSSRKILVGISLDAEESRELLYWVITFLAQPNDTVVALHVLVTEETKKPLDRKKEENKEWQSITKYQKKVRHAKNFVISVMGEFAKACQSKQVNLEARVGYSSNVGIGLTKEAKSIPADFLLIGGKKKRSNKKSRRIRRYCCDHIPESCSLVLVGKHGSLQTHNSHSNSKQIEDFHQSSTRWSEKDQISNSVSSDEEHAVSKTKREKSSPRTVLDACEGESRGTMEDSSSIDESSIIKSPYVASERKRQSESKRPMSPLKIISSFFRSPFDLNARKRNDAFFSKDKKQPMLKCFGYEEIANATNNFHPGRNLDV